MREVEPMRLAGKVIVVTGGSRGIGRATVLKAIEQGARVVFCSRTMGEEAREVQAEAEKRGSHAVAVCADVLREADVDTLFDAAIEAFGRVDVAINNAGISRESLLLSVTSEDWDAVVATNLTGSFLVARRAIREFLRCGEGGRIVSVGTLSQNGAAGNASYAASKGGLLGLTQMIARQYGDRGVFANLVATGFVETAMTASVSEEAKRAFVQACPMRRPGTVEEVAAAVLFLASGRASGTNGQAIYLSGGLLDVSL
jgi:3-oxoacyl-[acyl-carrier protein] reductase